MKIPLLYRLLLLVGLILAVPLVFQLLYITPRLREHEIQMEYHAQEDAASLLAERVDNVLGYYHLRLENMSKLQGVREFDDAILARDIPERLAHNDWIHGVAIFDTASNLVFSEGEAGFDQVLAAYAADFDVSVGKQTGTVTVTEAGELVFSMCSPISPAVDIPGVTGCLLSVIGFAELEADLADAADSAGRVAYLVDQHGRLLASSEPEATLSQLTHLSDHPAVLHIHDYDFPAGVHHTLEHEQALITHITLDSAPWQIIVETPINSVFSQSSMLSQWNLWANSIVLGVMLILAWGLAIWIARERSQHEEALQAAARHDALTGLLNRLSLDEALVREEARAKRYKSPIGVLMIDVNRFKEINDRFGHQMGDQVLQGVADVLSESVRETDIVFRYAGDEFVVLLPETPGEAEIVLLRIHATVAKRNESNPLLDFPVTLAIGSVQWEPTMDVSLEKIVEQADAKMYTDKRKKAEE